MNDFLADRARISPHKPALFFEGQAWTYSELNLQVARFCARLDEFGVGQGARVAVYLPNQPDFVMLVHGLVRMGAVIVPLNLRLTEVEIADLIEQAEIDWLISSGEPLQLKNWTALKQHVDIHEITDREPENINKWMSRPVDLDRDWGILFTSGTSGRAKGAVLTVGNLYFSAMASALRLGSFDDDRWLLGMPLYHVGGLSIVFRCAIYGTAVVLQDGFDAGDVLASIERFRVTMISLVPTMLQKVMDGLGAGQLPAYVRLVLLGGAAAPEALVQQALDKGLPVALTYGLTEAASQVATAPVGAVLGKLGSVGKPLYQTELRIASNIGQGFEPVGVYGEIQVKGPTVMRGYLGQPELNGWLGTGDIGYIDESGDLFVLQRRTDLIVSGGENVYPAEVEKIIREHPAVVDVCVVGIPDKVWGERVAAVIVPRAHDVSYELIENYLRGRLAGFKLPRTVVFADELPYTASGKVSRTNVIALLEQSI